MLDYDQYGARGRREAVVVAASPLSPLLTVSAAALSFTVLAVNPASVELTSLRSISSLPPLTRPVNKPPERPHLPAALSSR